MRQFAHHDHARALVGCAVGHVVAGTPENIRRARSAVTRAVQIFMATGMTQDQAIHEVISFAQLLSAVE